MNRSQVGVRLTGATKVDSPVETARPPLCVGLLAIQGDFAKHREAVERLGHASWEVRTIGDLKLVDCLIMPGGESTTMRKLLKLGGLWEAIPDFARDHAIMGTCAGLILLGKRILNARSDEDTLGLIDIDTDRNAYGSQYHSFRATGEARFGDASESIEMVFIRAPKITRVGHEVEVRGTLNSEPAVVQQGTILAMTFHPEMTSQTAVHEYFFTQVARPSHSR